MLEALERRASVDKGMLEDETTGGEGACNVFEVLDFDNFPVYARKLPSLKTYIDKANCEIKRLQT